MLNVIFRKLSWVYTAAIYINSFSAILQTIIIHADSSNRNIEFYVEFEKRHSQFTLTSVEMLCLSIFDNLLSTLNSFDLLLSHNFQRKR